MRVLLRFKWLILGVTLGATTAGSYATRLVAPVYTARTTIWIDQSGRRGNSAAAPFQASQAFSPEAWVNLLRSNAVLDSVVIKCQLYLGLNTPMDSALVRSFGIATGVRLGDYRLRVDSAGQTFVLSSNTGALLERGAVGGPVGTRLGFRWTPPVGSIAPGSVLRFTVQSPSQAASWLGQALKPRIDADGNFLTVEMSGSNPIRIAAVLNSIAEQYVRVAADLKRVNVGDRSSILGEQLRSAREKLDAAESALERFRLDNVNTAASSELVPALGRSAVGDVAEGGTIATTAYLAQRLALDSIQQERQTILRVLAAPVNSPLSVDELQRLGSVRNSTALTQALKDYSERSSEVRSKQLRYTDAYPEVQRLQGELTALERVTIPQLARAVAAQLEGREKDLQRRTESTTQALRSIPPRAIEGARLERIVRLTEATYNTLQQRYGEAQLAELSVPSDIRVLDRAEPPQWPEKNTRRQLLLLSFVVGLGLSAGGAILVDRLDPRFRYPQQVTRELGLSILGAVPHLKEGGSARARGTSAAELREALRAIRMNVEYAFGSSGVLAFTVSSPGAADGKSFLAINLARTFAEGGRRTLLVDADLRRGRLHHRCGVSRKPGIADCLHGVATLDQMVRATEYPRLDIVTSGTRVHDAPELLASPAMAHLVGEMRTRYEVIVCDSPPLAAGVDPYLLSTLTSHLLLVVRTGVSLRDVTEAKMEVLDRMPVRVLGAVLNDVPKSSVYGGYYSHYLPGYDTSDEATGLAAPPIVR